MTSPRLYGTLAREPADPDVSPLASGGGRWARARRWRWLYAFPCVGCGIFCEDALLRDTGLVLATLVLGGSALTVLQGFVVRNYHWSNATSTWVGVGVLVIFLVGVTISASAVQRIGPIWAMRVGLLAILVGFFILTFAPFSPIIAIIGAMSLASAGTMVPPLAVLLTRIVPRERQGQFQTATTSLSLGVAAPAAIAYSTLFSDVGTLLGTISSTFAVATAILFVAVVGAEIVYRIHKRRVDEAFAP